MSAKAESLTSVNRKAEKTVWTAGVPGLATDPVPVEPYASSEYFEREREAIFKRCWLNVGRIDDIPEAGDYFLQDLAVCHTSLLIVRGNDDVVRSFHNVCQHRGNHVVWQSSGRRRSTFTCKFHGWSYDTKGRLVGVPDEDNFFELNKNNRGLKEVTTDVWRGFIFINLQDQPEQSLDEYLGDAGRALGRYPFEKMTVAYPYRPEIAVNWKVLLDAQQEGYHVPTLHKISLAPSVAKLNGGIYRSHSFEAYGPHRRISTPANPHFEPNPTAGLSAQYGTGAADAFAGISEAAGAEADVMHGIFDFTVIFPNFVIATLYGTYFTYNLWPLAADRTIWDIRMYYPRPQSAGQMFANEYGRIVLRDTLIEDASVHEHIQAGLKSGALTDFKFQDEEVACLHQYAAVTAYVEGRDPVGILA